MFVAMQNPDPVAQRIKRGYYTCWSTLVTPDSPDIPTRAAYLSVRTFRRPSVVSGRSPLLKFAIAGSALGSIYMQVVEATISLLPGSPRTETRPNPYWPCSSLEQQD